MLLFDNVSPSVLVAFPLCIVSVAHFSAMDDSKILVLVLLDLSAAFDTIDHEILLHHLHNVFGSGDTVLSWFQSYLENRTQTVVVHGKHSTPASLRYGVPQGSVLGPILLLFTHSLYQM